MVAQLDSLYIRTSFRQTLTRLLSYAFFEGRPLTTQGQWINPLVFALFKIQKALPQWKSVKKPIFIVGTGRSGTTVLGTIFSMHHEVGYLNEPKALWHSIYPHEDLAGSYSRDQALYRLEPHNASQVTVKYANKLVGSYLQFVGAKRLVDKYPELIFRIPFVKALFPDAKFIFLIRNGWDTCQSIEKWSQDKGVTSQSELHDWWGLNNRKWKLLWEQLIETDSDLVRALPPRQELENPLDMATLEWIITMREGLRIKHQYPDDMITLRYEDLVLQPYQSLSGIFEFCELTHDERCLNYACQRIKAVPEKHAFDMHAALYPYFEETMNMLEYSV